MSDEGYDWGPHLGDGGGDLPPIWKAENVGDSVKGTVESIRDHEDKKYGRGTFPVVTLVQDDETLISVFAQQAGLKRGLAERNPQPGDRVGVRYDGEEAMDNGFKVKLWTVFCEKATPAPEDDDSPF